MNDRLYQSVYCGSSKSVSQKLFLPLPQVTVFIHLITADANRTMRVTPDPARTSRLLTNSNNFQSSRRSSEDSLEDAGLSRDMRVRLQYYDWIFSSSSFYDDISMKFGCTRL